MLVTAIMLGVALLPTGDDLWFTGDVYFTLEDAGAIPAFCYFQRLARRTTMTGPNPPRCWGLP